jgi:hypothetical protein
VLTKSSPGALPWNFAKMTSSISALAFVGMDTFVDPRRQGARMNDCTPEFVRLVNFEGDEWLFFPSLPPNVAIGADFGVVGFNNIPDAAQVPNSVRRLTWAITTPRLLRAASA